MRYTVKAAGKLGLFIVLLMAMQFVIPANGNAYYLQQEEETSLKKEAVLIAQGPVPDTEKPQFGYKTEPADAVSGTPGILENGIQAPDPITPETDANLRQETNTDKSPYESTYENNKKNIGGIKEINKPDEVRAKPLKTAYITIDDGPSKTITDMNLDTLKSYGIKATFFVLPYSGLKDIYKRIIDEGHVIGNHSFSHNYGKLYNDPEFFREDVLKAREFIFNMVGYTTTLYRFPGGAMGRDRDMIKERAEILKELGYTYFDWHVSTGDTNAEVINLDGDEAVRVITENVLNNTKDRKKLIVLMHDSKGKMNSAKALPQIIEGLMEQGYGFDVLSNY